ncbi:catechol 2,3-dioxygenase-like lactoylglutathione lyase family enzyme [Saccharopolyspora erythraea NRRL 2338]|uniref:Possible lyase n=2 Tax=Saccharopolyspora erythraea TaxID=1836 RepID=A4F6L5_SACEN|nr:VOC family protein [Saccharopolyspora erythraea]EQD87242.1 glyoxalase [Saccharopolyspora erythraea D]PFG93492.1 catechol 2,3-dioxygenase-like lactoylglutathione lyase family enzyme [Saccharopolyspora erythraea NRRL 2338]QRK90354.1 VOC family protein [Saccharopolyspora erythraea]CAL99689.1 possible lyase [Saccharopolyspora erythraea NRRL 2338]
MITGLSIATVWVLDQESAKRFYTEKLGFELRTDSAMGDFRWVTVGAEDQPGLEITLMEAAAPSLDPESAEQVRSLLAKGVLGAGVLSTDDCHATYRELSARGVEFVQEPTNRPYGIEALLRDDSGNWFSLTQRHEEMDPTAEWDPCVEGGSRN